MIEQTRSGRGERDKRDRSPSRRAQSELLGIVLLFGLVIVTAAVTLLIGSIAISDLQGSVDMENALHSMREVDSRLSRVAYNDNAVETLSFGQSVSEAANAPNKAQVLVRNESYINVTVNEEWSECSANITMGSLVRETPEDEVVAYEGGGVWRGSAPNSTMVSPPDLQYQNGTINFPLVSVNGSVSGASGELVARKNVTESRKRSRQIGRQLANHPSCRPPQNLTIEVQSDYYQAWGRYFGEVTPKRAEYDHDARKARVTLKTRAGSTGAVISGSSLTSTVDYIAEIRVNGTGYHTNGWHLPIAFVVEVEGEGAKTIVADPSTGGTTLRSGFPQMDGPDNDDLNDPRVAHEQGVYPQVSISVDAGKNFSVRGISYACNPAADDDGTISGGELTWKEPSVLYDTGTTKPDTRGHTSGPRRADNMDDRCYESDLGDREFRNLSTAGQSKFLRIYNSSKNTVSGANASDFEGAPSFQRTPEEVLQDNKYVSYDSSTNTLDLDDNEAIFVYEFNENYASGDYNDGIVTVRAFAQGAISQSDSIAIKISTSKVRISED